MSDQERCDADIRRLLAALRGGTVDDYAVVGVGYDPPRAAAIRAGHFVTEAVAGATPEEAYRNLLQVVWSRAARAGEAASELVGGKDFADMTKTVFLCAWHGAILRRTERSSGRWVLQFAGDYLRTACEFDAWPARASLLAGLDAFLAGPVVHGDTSWDQAQNLRDSLRQTP